MLERGDVLANASSFPLHIVYIDKAMFASISSNIHILQIWNGMEICWFEVLTSSDIQSTNRFLDSNIVDNREKSCSSLLPMMMDDLCFHNMCLVGNEERDGSKDRYHHPIS